MLMDIFRSRGEPASAAWHKQDVGKFAVASHVSRYHAMRVGPVAKDRGPGAVSEQNAGISVGPVHDRAQFVSPNDKHSVVNVGRNKLLGDFHRVKKTGASG